MLDAKFAVTGKKLNYRGKIFTITSAGIKEDQAFATVDPHDETVVQTIVKHICKCMPLPFALEDIQVDLA
jgi:hypothetical protein